MITIMAFIVGLGVGIGVFRLWAHFSDSVRLTPKRLGRFQAQARPMFRLKTSSFPLFLVLHLPLFLVLHL
jgi:hypothetical protein